MGRSKLLKCYPIKNTITIVIHLNYTCNFKCSYCIAGREFYNIELGLEDISILFNVIKKLNNLYKEVKIDIDINGGEPTLHSNFTYIISKFIQIKNIRLQVSTNGYLIYSLRNKLFIPKILINSRKLKFNISFHYFEYLGKLDIFIKSIKILKKYKINIHIKFLLPDEGESLIKFKKIFNKIKKETGIQEKDFGYYLLMNFKGGISKSYSKEMIAYYQEKQKSKNKENKENINKFNKKIKPKDYYYKEEAKKAEKDIKEIEIYDPYNDVTLEFENGKRNNYTFEYLKYKELNKFRGFNCFYIYKGNALIYIGPNGEVTFGSCLLLDKNKFNLIELEQILFSGNKSILCNQNTCTSGLRLPKVKSFKYKKLFEFEIKLKRYIEKNIKFLSLEDVQVSFNQNIIIILKINIYNIAIIIESNKPGNKYFIVKNCFGYELRIKDDNNIVIKTDKIERKYLFLINKYIVMLSKLDFLYKKVIKINEK